MLEKTLNLFPLNLTNPDSVANQIKPSLSFLKNKAKTLEDIYNNAKYIISDEIKFEAEDLESVVTSQKNFN